MLRLFSCLLVALISVSLFSGCVDEDRDAAHRAQVRQNYYDRQATLAAYHLQSTTAQTDETPAHH